MQERQVKMVLVTVGYRGKSYWQLVAARKVGKQYHISLDAYQEVVKRCGAGYGQTITFG